MKYLTYVKYDSYQKRSIIPLMNGVHFPRGIIERLLMKVKEKLEKLMAERTDTVLASGENRQ